MSAAVCSDASNYGKISVSGGTVDFTSFDSQSILTLKLEQVSQCVVPASNRDEVEIHFHDDEKGHQKDDILAQITFHFPIDEDNENETKAEEFKKLIVDSGVTRSVTGDVIVEFTKEQGNFITPRLVIASNVQFYIFI